ncbi:unnamed protein product [Schistosoma spindalis]|nr:unnamed protein product [Schistosoma spindale]
MHVQQALTTQALSLDSVYNEHLLTISQLQDEIKSLQRQLTLKDSDLLTKDRTIAELRSEMIEIKSMNEDRVRKIKSAAQLEQDRLLATIRQLQKEKAIISHNIKRRKINNNLSRIANRNSLSSTTLFNPDSPLSLGLAKRVSKPPVLENQGKEREGEETLSYSDRISKNTLHSTSRSMKRQLTPDCIGVQIYDEDSNLAPQRTVTSSIKQNAGSPGITPSISSKTPTDDEEASQLYQYDPHEISGKNPLGLDTPSESENETPD